MLLVLHVLEAYEGGRGGVPSLVPQILLGSKALGMIDSSS